MVRRQGTAHGQGRGQAGSIAGAAWNYVVGWVRQESAATTALVQAFIALGIAFEWWHWTPAQTGAVIGIVAALLGMFVRSQVAPIHRLRPQAEPGALGPGANTGFEGEPDSGVRVLPSTGAGAGQPARPGAGPAARPGTGQPTRPDIEPTGGPNVPPNPPGPAPRQ